MFSPEFYRCDACGNLIWLISDSSVPVYCCGSEMRKLVPGESDGSAEKHVPVIEERIDSLYVQVGSFLHPDTSDHHIEWIALQTDTEMFFRALHPGNGPSAIFSRYKGKPVAVYAYCNIHGLWKANIHS